MPLSGTGGGPSAGGGSSGFGGVPQSKAESKALKTWNKRIETAKAAGADINSHVIPIARFDMQKVRGGATPMGESTFQDLYTTLKTGKSPAKKQESGFSLNPIEEAGNLRNEVQDIAGGLIHLPQALVQQTASAARSPSAPLAFLHNQFGFDVPGVDYKAYEQSLREGKKTYQKQGLRALIQQGLKQPGAEMVPGAYTLGSAVADPKEILQHPISHTLDVLPYASSAGKALTAGRLGAAEQAARVSAAENPARFTADEAGQITEGKPPVEAPSTRPPIKPGSAAEAFQAGRPIKGLARALGKNVEAPTSTSGVTTVARGGVVKPITEAANQIAERFRITAASRDVISKLTTETAGVRGGVDETRRVVGQQAKGLLGGSKKTQAAAVERVTQDVLQGTPETAAALTSDGERLLADQVRSHQQALQDAQVANKNIRVLPSGEAYLKSDPVVKSFDRLNAAQEKLDQLKRSGASKTELAAQEKIVQTRTKGFVQRQAIAPPRAWHYRIQTLLDQSIRERLQGRLDAGALTAEDHAQRLSYLEQGRYGKVFDNPVELRRMVHDWAQEWEAEAANGVRPTYLPHAPEGEFSAMAYAKPLPDRKFTPSMLKQAKLGNLQPGVANYQLQVTYQAAQQLMADSTEALMSHIYEAHGVSLDKIEEIYNSHKMDVPKLGRQVDTVSERIRNDWVAFSDVSGKYVGQPRVLSVWPNAGKVMIPRSVAESFDKVVGSLGRGGNIFDKPVNVFRIAVTSTPRHIAHILVSGAVWMGGEYGLSPFRFLPDAWRQLHAPAKLAKEIGAAAKTAPEEMTLTKAITAAREAKTLGKGTKFLPAGVPQHISMFTADEITSHLEGEVMGRTLLQNWKHPIDALRHFEGQITDMYRAMTYLEAEKRALGTMSPVEARMKGLEMVNKVQLSIADLTPLERTITRYVMPFYPFTRQILRYLYRMPADHPWRVAVITRLADQERQDHSTGLPLLFTNYMFLGQPDKQGNVDYIDMKTLNPFRSLDGQNPATLAGFLSSLNPAAQVAMETLNIDPLAASSQRARQHVDPETGNLVDTHPPLIDTVLNTYVPESQILRDWFGVANHLNRLKHTAGSDYRKEVLSLIGVPFMPYSVNLRDKRLTLEANRIKEAKAVVDEAIYSGNTSMLSSYPTVPFQGQTVRGSDLAKLIQGYTKRYPGVSPKTSIPQPSFGRGGVVRGKQPFVP